jgi:hypothetical protein
VLESQCPVEWAQQLWAHCACEQNGAQVTASIKIKIIMRAVSPAAVEVQRFNPAPEENQ